MTIAHCTALALALDEWARTNHKANKEAVNMALTIIRLMRAAP